MTADRGAASSRDKPDVEVKVAELIASGKTIEAARFYTERGAHAEASRLFEEACDFAAAGREALAVGDAKRAVQLGALGGDDELCARAIKALASTSPRQAALRAAGDLTARGLTSYAGALLAELGEHAEAAQAFVAADDARRAATCFELAGRAADGARALEVALRRRPDDEGVRLDLGRLLARHGRTEAAVRALQHLAPRSENRAKALPLLARCLVELGFEDAAKSARDEMEALGIVADDALPGFKEDGGLEGGLKASGPAASKARDPRRSEASSGEDARGASVLLFGRYESIREVASTPHARVIEALDRVTSERVAIKIFAGSTGESGRDAILRFEREARALAQLRHPNVVPLHAYLSEGPAMVLAWMAGGSLADKIREEPIAPRRAVEIACALLSALGEAHRLGILHRDVKPTNVLFDAIGTAHLSDFGAAHLGDLSSTATEGAIGTFAYMSPEQRMGRAASMTSDLYGVGAVLYELLAGEPARPAAGGRLDLPPSAQNPELRAAHDAVLASLLADDPLGRPGDAFEARRALQSLSWPADPPAKRAATRRPASEHPPRSALTRLAPAMSTGDGRDAALRRHDGWLGRDVLVLPLTNEPLTRARAFARAGHAALPAVLRVDRDEQQIWVAAPQGSALADNPRALSPGQLARLCEAIAALHAVGGAHGCIDCEHLYWHDGEVTLAFPRSRATLDDIELDRQVLARLEGSRQP